MIPGSANSLLMRPAADDEVVTKSCRFDGTSSYLSRTFGAGDRKTWTLAAWVKLGSLSPTSATGTILARTAGAANDGGPTIWMDGGPRFAHAFDPSGTDNVRMTKAIYRDPAAWYHVVWWCDMTVAGTSGDDRWKIYVNGVLQELETPSGYNGEPAQDVDMGINDAANHSIGTYASQYFSGLLTDVYFVDGSAVVPTIGTNFIQRDGTTGQLKPKAYTVSGTNGFHLDFMDTSNTGKDAAGSNDFLSAGLLSYDQLPDRPTNNYCVWNPLTTSHAVLTEGNLEGDAADHVATVGSIGVNSGQWYWEIYTDSGDYMPYIGVTSIADDDWDFGGTDYASAGRSFIGGDVANKNYDATSIDTSVPDLSGTAVWGMALDFSAGTLKYYRDGSLKHTDDDIPTDGTTLWPFQMTTDSGIASWKNFVLNAGQDPTFAGKDSSTPATSEFAETVPAGYSALSTANLPDPPIAKGNEYFDTVLYTGNGGTKTVTFPAVETDLVWIKGRDVVADAAVYDTMRTATQRLELSLAGVEETKSTGLTAFTTKGFTLGLLAGSNQDTKKYVAWNWQADLTGSGGTADGWAENYNSDAGFSIVKWTGDDRSTDGDESQTVHHTLGYAPDFIIAKPRTNESSGNKSWIVYHKDLATDKFLKLNESNAEFDGSQGNNDNLIHAIGSTSVGFANDSVSTAEYLNFGGNDFGQSADTYIAYLFREVAGYSKFGTYLGNNDNDGTFVWCGFRPRMILMKSRENPYFSSAYQWAIFDTARSSYNIERAMLVPDQSGTESTAPSQAEAADIDILSNGFKPRFTPNETNGPNNYIFAAFAEQPFKYAAAR